MSLIGLLADSLIIWLPAHSTLQVIKRERREPSYKIPTVVRLTASIKLIFLTSSMFFGSNATTTKEVCLAKAWDGNKFERLQVSVCLPKNRDLDI